MIISILSMQLHHAIRIAASAIALRHHIISLIFLCATITKTMGTDAPIPPDSIVLDKLRNIIISEENKEGTFIKTLVHDLKECTNGKMIELSYFKVKSSYWWDKRPYINHSFEPHNFNSEKIIIIDNKFRSSVYDRDLHDKTDTIRSFFDQQKIDVDYLMNSWESGKQKAKFFQNMDVDWNPIPKSLKEIMGCGYNGRKLLDTYPSIYQMLRAYKTLKYETKAPTKCLEKSTEDPSEVILNGVNNILGHDTYNRFKQQNHPLSQIVQGHLRKLKHKAEEKHFKPNIEKAEYQKPILYRQILQKMGDLIQLMSVFDIDIDKGMCNIPGSNEWGTDKSSKSYYLYVQLYEVINDLLFLLMSVENPYTQQDFDTFLTESYIRRFPIFKDLSTNKDILMASYPMRSGMDAIVNASMAIGHAPQGISIAPKVGFLENTIYFEIDDLLTNYPHRGDMKSPVFLTKNPDTELKARIDNAILQAYVENQIDLNIPADLEHVDLKIVKKIGIQEYIAELINSFKANKALEGLYLIDWQIENVGSHEDLISLAKETLTEFTMYYVKLNNIQPDVQAGNVVLHEIQKFGLKIDQIPKIDVKETSDSLRKVLQELSESLYDNFYVALVYNLYPFMRYLEKQQQRSAKKMVFDELKKSLPEKNMFVVNEIGGEPYIEVPLFMTKNPNFFPKLIELFPDIIGNTFTLDKYHAMTSGMTTDTVDPSHDPAFMEKLHHKINQIRQLKQSWNPSEEPFIILWDTTMEIDQGPGYALMEKFRAEIESGKIAFVLAKSLQKYANLGVGKSKAGVVTLVGKRGPVVENIHNKLTSYGRDVFSNRHEYSLMTFFFEPYGQDNEKFYYQAVRKHAQKLQGDCMISGGCLFTKHPHPNWDIPYSYTFGFAIPTAIDVRENSLRRYSVGLNPLGLQ